MSEPEFIKVWVTKYALTTGLLCVDAEVCHNISSDMVTWGDKFSQYAHGKEWHRTEAEALKCAEKMREAKIASLKRSISKLEKLEFKAYEKLEVVYGENSV